MEILNGLQGREYNRAQATALYLSQQTKVYTLYEPFAEEVIIFSDNNARLVALVPAKDVNGESVTIGKAALKTMVSTQGNIICTRVAAYARKIGNIDLEKSVYYRTSEIHELKDADVLGFITRLVGIITPLLTNTVFQKYAVTQAMLDTITDAAQDFNDTIGKSDIVNTSRGFASRTINAILKSIRENMVQFHLLLNYFEDSYPAFVDGFSKASAVNNSGIHHSGIEGIVKDSITGLPIKGVVITGEGKKKIAKTDDNGAYRLIRLKTCTMTITITFPDYENQSIKVKIIRGKILEFNFLLRALAINIATA